MHEGIGFQVNKWPIQCTSVSHSPQPMLQLLFMYEVARVAGMDACIQQHGLPLTKATLVTTYAEYAANQE